MRRPQGVADDAQQIGTDLVLMTQPSWAAFVGLLMLVSLGTLIVAAVGSYRDARRAPA